MTPRVLVAGIGNVFFGDDAFGVEVARRLTELPLPNGVRCADYGIRGVHLAYDLLDAGYDTLVMVDALPLDEQPGTIAVLDGTDERPDPFDAPTDAPTVDAHTMHPLAVLRTFYGLGGQLDRVLVVGCQPARIEPRMGLSDEVAAAVPEAVHQVRGLVAELTDSAAVPVVVQTGG